MIHWFKRKSKAPAVDPVIRDVLAHQSKWMREVAEWTMHLSTRADNRLAEKDHFLANCHAELDRKDDLLAACHKEMGRLGEELAIAYAGHSPIYEHELA